jgi:hypothetical protein
MRRNNGGGLNQATEEVTTRGWTRGRRRSVYSTRQPFREFAPHGRKEKLKATKAYVGSLNDHRIGKRFKVSFLYIVIENTPKLLPSEIMNGALFCLWTYLNILTQGNV